MQKYEFHYDAGHGWLKVSHAELRELGIAHKISSYSYRDENYAYLEEDCDAPLFEEAAHLTPGQYIEVDDGNDSFIRNLQRYDLGMLRI